MRPATEEGGTVRGKYAGDRDDPTCRGNQEFPATGEGVNWSIRKENWGSTASLGARGVTLRENMTGSSGSYREDGKHDCEHDSYT